MKKHFIVLLGLASTLSLTAQNGKNLVPNPSFEDLGKSKIKEPGSVFLAQPWKSVTMNPVDLYSANTKNDEFGVPENKYGEEKAKTGENYAGVNFFGYRGKVPRTYLGVELTDTLVAGKQYCLKFHISMSDRSKYAVNNIGLLVTKEEMTEKSDANIYKEPQIISVTNRVYEKQFSWTAVCGTMTAEGGEKFITIGNFSKDEDTQQETVRIDRDIGGRQTYDGYYFIDDVSVIDTESLSEKDCACEKIAGGKLKVEYKSFGTKLEDQKEEKTETTIINSDGTKMGDEKPKVAEEGGVEKDGIVYKKMTSDTSEEEEEVKEEAFNPESVVIEYENKAFNFPESASDQLMEIVTYLKANPKKVIVVTGHADPSESSVKSIGQRRSIFTLKALTDAGISKERIEYDSKGTTVKAPDGGNNSRVTFKVK